MFKPTHRLIIRNDGFYPDECICLGSQVVKIVHSLQNILPSHSWYGADVAVWGEKKPLINLADSQLLLIGGDQEFIEYSMNIDQFIWGDFICIDHTKVLINGSVEIETEDDPFRPIDLEGILLEIRTFDTTFIAVYSENLSFLKKIADKYPGDIETKRVSIK
jgi:hypothetical protein